MANSLDDTKIIHPQESKKVSSNGQRNSKKRQHQKNNAAQKVARGGNVNNPIHETVSVSAHDVEVTLDAVKKQEASEQGFSSGSICLVLASEGYDADDYIRDYDDYLEYIKTQR